MPPPVSPESDLDSQYSSGSESIRAPNNALSTETPQYHASQHALDAPGVPFNKAKRKAESESDSPAPKTRRTESSDPESDDTDDEEDIPADGGYLSHSFFAAEAPVLNPAPVSLPPPELSTSQTALELLKKLHPQFPLQPRRPGSLYTFLGAQPVKRVPVVTHRFNNVKPQNPVAFFMQAIGDMVHEDEACDRCLRRSGVFPGHCVVVRHPAVLEVTGGACANCWYNRQGCLCSFRQSTPQSDQATPLVKRMQLSPPGGPVPEPPGPTPKPQQKPVPPAPASAPAPAAPIHPSYAAALAAGSLTAGAVTTGAVAASPALNGSASASAANSKPKHLSHDDKVRAWENRYGTMSTSSLLSAHEHLAEWQEDLTTRLLAMNKVVLKRLQEREG